MWFSLLGETKQWRTCSNTRQIVLEYVKKNENSRIVGTAYWAKRTRIAGRLERRARGWEGFRWGENSAVVDVDVCGLTDRNAPACQRCPCPPLLSSCQRSSQTREPGELETETEPSQNHHQIIIATTLCEAPTHHYHRLWMYAR